MPIGEIMKKVTLAILLAIMLITLSGCSEMLFMNSKYPEEYKNLVVTSATDYIMTNYGVMLGDTQPVLINFSTTMLGDTNMPVVRFKVGTKTVRVWNSLCNPITDIDYMLYSDLAQEKMTAIAKDIFGEAIETVNAPIGYYGTGADAPCKSVDDFLSRKYCYTYMMAVADDIPDKAKLVSKFQSRLKEEGIKASFGLYFYTDYSVMLKDFRADKAICGQGDFTDWVFCTDNSLDAELRGKGTSYKQSSK
jgi:hypothetical protein